MLPHWNGDCSVIAEILDVVEAGDAGEDTGQ